MKISDLSELQDLEVIVPGNPDREITGGVAGDLLSCVMAEAEPGMIWVTIQVHVNVAAVAVLRDVSGIVLASGRKPNPDLVEKCREESLFLGVCSRKAFDACVALHALGVRGDA
jgi:hypothetical protein